VRPDLLEILRCPICHGELVLTVRAREGTDIVTGNLHCPKCSADYPIEDGIPDMLPPDERD
jgi:uncharacterized protein YbaR (Trm112 family)